MNSLALGSYAEGVCLSRGPYPLSWPRARRGRGERAGAPGGTSWLAVRYFLSENMAVQNLIITLMSSRSRFSPWVGNLGGQLQMGGTGVRAR